MRNIFQILLFLIALIAFNLPIYALQVDFSKLKGGEKFNGDSLVGNNKLSSDNSIGVAFFHNGDTKFSATSAILYSGKKHVLLSSVANSTHFRHGNIYIYEEKLIKIFNTNLELISEIDPSNLCEFTRLNANEEDDDFSVEIWILSKDYLLLRCGKEYFINLKGEVLLERKLLTSNEVQFQSVTENIFLLNYLSFAKESAQIVVVDLQIQSDLADFTYDRQPTYHTSSFYSMNTQRIYVGNSHEGKGLHVFNINGNLLYTIDDISSWYSKYEPLEFADFIYVYDQSTNTMIKLDIDNGTILKKYPISSLFNQAELNNHYLYATRLINNKYYGIFANRSDRKNHRYDFTILELNSELNVVDSIKVTNARFSEIELNKFLSQKQK